MFLALQGATINEIHVRGDWASDAVYKYIACVFAERMVADLKVAATLGAAEQPSPLHGYG